ncbi:hypothetical protein BDC45DRAFT_36351 [Circinella umbellata]|nr:hypothetical protein BDC45DRAFT_36351 [Circinella umbellata]
MREKLFATLEEKRRKLKEEKDNCELAYDIVIESQAKSRRQLRKRGLEQSENKSSKRKQLSGPALVFKLREDDLQSDLHAMQIDAVSTPTNSKKVSNSSKKKS